MNGFEKTDLREDDFGASGNNIVKAFDAFRMLPSPSRL